jgi:hypothetical protein
MVRIENWIWYLIAFVAVGGVVAFGLQLSSEARMRRRRRKSHSRIMTKGRRQTVKFSVKPPKE